VCADRASSVVLGHGVAWIVQNERAEGQYKYCQGERKNNKPALGLMLQLHTSVMVGNFPCVRDVVSVLLQRYVHFSVISVLDVGNAMSV